MSSKTTPPTVQAAWPPLHNAIWRAAGDDDLSTLQTMLAQGVNMLEVADTHAATQATVLHTGCKGSVALLDLLIDHGANIVLESQCGPGEDGRWSGSTPLQMAAREGNQAYARRLLEFGADYDIFSAIALGDQPHVAKLIEQDPSAVNLRDDYQATLLHWAAAHAQPAVSEFLIEQGVNVNAVDSFDETPILAAAVRQAQLRHAASATDKSDSLVDVLRKHAAPLDAHTAAALGDLAVQQRLLQQDRNLAQTKNRHGTTPLHWAARNAQLATAELLLDCGADINAADEIGCPPLWCAAYWGRDTAMVELLCQRKANLHFRNRWGKDINAYDIGHEHASIISKYRISPGYFTHT